MLFSLLVYIYILYIVRANFVLITRKKAERNFEIAARTLCLRVCGATPRYRELYHDEKETLT